VDFWLRSQPRSRTRTCAQLREHIPDFTLGSLIPLRDPFSLRGGDPRLVVVFGATDLARDLRDRRVQNREELAAGKLSAEFHSAGWSVQAIQRTLGRSHATSGWIISTFRGLGRRRVTANASSRRIQATRGTSPRTLSISRSNSGLIGSVSRSVRPVLFLGISCLYLGE
jgi:hypothetical protein